MSKWIIPLIAAFVVLAIIGFLVEAARAIVGIALVVVAIAFVVSYLRRKGSSLVNRR